MSEQAATQRKIDGTLLENSFQALGIRRAYLEGFYGAGRLATHVPKHQAWASRKPQELGASIGNILAGGEAELRLYSVTSAAIPRQVQRPDVLTRLPYAHPIREGGSIQAAEVIGVTDIDVGRGRMLPVLHLMEFGNPSPKEEFIVAVSDIARRVQTGRVEVAIA